MSANPERSYLPVLLTFLGGIAAIIAFAKYDDWRDESVSQEIKKYETRLSVFVDVALQSSQEVVVGRSATKKPIIVCMQSNDRKPPAGHRGSRAIDPLTLDLPDDLKPKNADEVQSVVALYWGQQQLGRYEGGDSAMRETCRVEVFDIATGKLVARRELVGGEPPQTIEKPAGMTFHQSHFGANCDRQVIEFLKELYK